MKNLKNIAIVIAVIISFCNPALASALNLNEARQLALVGDIDRIEEQFRLHQEDFDSGRIGAEAFKEPYKAFNSTHPKVYQTTQQWLDTYPTSASALAAREKGVPLVNIAQPFKSSGMMLTCRADSGITSPADFPGKTLGVWFFGNEYPFLSWMSQLGIATDGGENGVEILKQGFNVDPILQGQAACVSTMTYNEYWQIIDAGLTPDDLVTFKYEDEGVATLEDGLYVLEDRLADPDFAEEMVRFVRASMQGWKWAEENPDAAADIVLENDETGAQTIEHQRRMMGEIAKLTAGSNGTLDEADFQRTVDTLLAGGSDPVISGQPEGAWTSAITDKALGM